MYKALTSTETHILSPKLAICHKINTKTHPSLVFRWEHFRNDSQNKKSIPVWTINSWQSVHSIKKVLFAISLFLVGLSQLFSFWHSWCVQSSVSSWREKPSRVTVNGFKGRKRFQGRWWRSWTRSARRIVHRRRTRTCRFSQRWWTFFCYKIK